MLGMVDGNGHPYSWSAIINGRYDTQAMADSGYPGILAYLEPQPPENLGIPGAQVTRVWCDDPAESVKVAKASFVPLVTQCHEDVIGQVDAVVIATDKGGEHVDRARPFIEAGLDVLSTEPPADNPLLTAKNCCIAPHIAWATHSARQRLLDTVIVNMHTFLSGKPPNVVND